MRLLFNLLLFVYLLQHLPAQNAFVQMFHPQYQELIPLVTDSLFIRIQSPTSGETTRAISFQHPDGLPEGWKEVYAEETPKRLWQKTQYAEHSTKGILYYNECIDAASSDTLKSRRFIFGAQLEHPDSVLNEIWRAGQWLPVQKTLFEYSGTLAINRQTEMDWNASAGQWENRYAKSNAYDSKKRLIKRTEDAWKQDAWNLQHSYRYAYRPNENKPKYSVW